MAGALFVLEDARGIELAGRFGPHGRGRSRGDAAAASIASQAASSTRSQVS